MGIYDLDLQELPLFEGLKADEVEQFIQATGAKVKRYGKEVRILKAYEANSRIGIIVEGEALVIAEDPASAMRLSAIGWSAERCLARRRPSCQSTRVRRPSRPSRMSSCSGCRTRRSS